MLRADIAEGQISYQVVDGTESNSTFVFYTNDFVGIKQRWLTIGV